MSKTQKPARGNQSNLEKALATIATAEPVQIERILEANPEVERKLVSVTLAEYHNGILIW